MTSYSMNRFLYMRRMNTLQADVTWRAYAFESAVKPRHVKLALKQLHLTYAGELALSQFMVMYEVPNREEAEAVLGQWWLWRAVSLGARMHVPQRSAAITLADGSPEAPTAPAEPGEPWGPGVGPHP